MELVVFCPSVRRWRAATPLIGLNSDLPGLITSTEQVLLFPLWV